MAPTICSSTNRLDGKTVIITGANAGIGKETAKDLVSRGARVIIACRNESKAAQAAEEIKKADEKRPDAVVIKKLDLASLASIRSFAEDILNTESKIDILINNAGMVTAQQLKTEDGFDMQFGVNHLGHFLLTNLLLDRIKASAPSRIVILSSIAHSRGRINFEDLHFEKKYDLVKAYAQSKLANILFAKELAKRLEGTGVTTYAVHPGVVRTEMLEDYSETLPSPLAWALKKSKKILTITPTQGAQTTIFCAVADETKDQSGLYYSDCKVKKPSTKAEDEATAKKLWDISCDLVGLDAVKNS